MIAAIGQSVERALAEREGLQVTGWGIAADERTLATNLPGVFAGGDAVLGRRPRGARRGGGTNRRGVDRPVPARRSGRPAKPRSPRHRDAAGGRRRAGGDLPRDRNGARACPCRRSPWSAALASFDEVEAGLVRRRTPAARRGRCLTCGCRKADCCRVRTLATEYDADPYRFAGARRRFSQDVSHPEIVYEPGKCIMCDACVRIAAAAGEALGLSDHRPRLRRHRGGAVRPARCRKACARPRDAAPRPAPPARSRCARARSCDLASCGGSPQSPPYIQIK